LEFLVDLNEQEQVDRLRTALAEQQGRNQRRQDGTRTCHRTIDRLRAVEIQHIEIDLPSKRLILETSLQSSKVQQFIERSLNITSVLLGVGENIASDCRTVTCPMGLCIDIGQPLAAAVSALYSDLSRPWQRRIHGLVRFIQTDDERCLIEGKLDGLVPNAPVQINVHEYGDLSDGCDR
jgi:hypothetical protein